MGKYLDTVPFSGIMRIRDLMFGIENPFRLDQGDVSFDAPPSVKRGIERALADNHTHYVQTIGLPRLRQLLMEKLRQQNGIPVEHPDQVLVTNGGIHGLYGLCQALLEPGDEVIVPDPSWPPAVGNVLAAHGVPVGCPLQERLGWKYDLDELRAKIGSRTRAIYVNSPHNPTGGVLNRTDLSQIAELARERNLWLISDEAYEDVVYEGAEHVSPASFPGMYGRTLSFFTFSKTYAITGLRLGYLAVADAGLRQRIMKVLFYTSTNVCSLAQYGGIGGLEGPRAEIDWFRTELAARRDLFYEGIASLGPEVFSGHPPKGAFYGFLKIGPILAQRACDTAQPTEAAEPSVSWAVSQYLITQARIGCVPGVDFGTNGEGYVRFCFARERSELTGALEAMRHLLGR